MSQAIPNPMQLPLLDLLAAESAPTGRGYRRRKLERTLAEMRKLHEELIPALESMINDEGKQRYMRENILKLALPGATNTIADEVIKLLER